MQPEIKKVNRAIEFETDERCHITEVANDPGDELVSIARARVEPGVTTAWHKLDNISERYIIVSGQGRVEVDDLEPVDVAPGDVVRIPADIAQRITNTGKGDLIFYAICAPPFGKPVMSASNRVKNLLRNQARNLKNQVFNYWNSNET